MAWQGLGDPHVAAKKLAAEIMGYECPACLTKIHGVSMMMGPPPEIDPEAEHLNFCLYRPTKCRIVNCGWEGNPMTLTSHVHAFHQSYIKRVELNQKYTQRYTFDFSTSPPSFEDWIIYHCEEEVFWKHTYLDSDKNMLMVRLYHLIKHREPKFSYYGVQTFKDISNSNFRYCHSMLADTKDIKEEEINEFSPYCMVVPSAELGNFSKGENCLNYSFQILKRPISWMDSVFS